MALSINGAARWGSSTSSDSDRARFVNSVNVSGSCFLSCWIRRRLHQAASSSSSRLCRRRPPRKAMEGARSSTSASSRSLRDPLERIRRTDGAVLVHLEDFYRSHAERGFRVRKLGRIESRVGVADPPQHGRQRFFNGQHVGHRADQKCRQGVAAFLFKACVHAFLNRERVLENGLVKGVLQILWVLNRRLCRAPLRPRPRDGWYGQAKGTLRQCRRGRDTR